MSESKINYITFALKCPFCGSDVEIEETTFGDSSEIYYRVNCKKKGHSLDWWSENINEAINVWNERPITDNTYLIDK